MYPLWQLTLPNVSLHTWVDACSDNGATATEIADTLHDAVTRGQLASGLAQQAVHWIVRDGPPASHGFQQQTVHATKLNSHLAEMAQQRVDLPDELRWQLLRRERRAAPLCAALPLLPHDRTLELLTDGQADRQPKVLNAILAGDYPAAHQVEAAVRLCRLEAQALPYNIGAPAFDTDAVHTALLERGERVDVASAEDIQLFAQPASSVLLHHPQLHLTDAGRALATCLYELLRDPDRVSGSRSAYKRVATRTAFAAIRLALGPDPTLAGLATYAGHPITSHLDGDDPSALISAVGMGSSGLLAATLIASGVELASVVTVPQLYGFVWGQRWLFDATAALDDDAAATVASLAATWNGTLRDLLDSAGALTR